MSTYDVAAGASPAGLNALAGQLFANAGARQNLFKGSVSQTVTTGINVALSYEAKGAPDFVLTPPTQQQWDAAHKSQPGAPLPTTNAFQLVFPDIAVSVTVPGVAPLTVEGPVTAFGTVSVVDDASAPDGAGKLVLVLVGLLLNASSSQFDKVVVDEILVPALSAMANKVLSGIPLPQLPPIEHIPFQKPPALSVSPGGLVAAASLQGDAPPDLSGFAFPQPPLFLLARGTAVDKVLAKAVPSTVKDEDSKGPSAWKASGGVTATDLSVRVDLAGRLAVDVWGKFSVYGELSGAGVGVTKAVLCPIGAAADAIAHPSNWDKVVTDFVMTDLPKPMVIPVEVKAAAITGPKGAQNQPVTVTVPADSLPSSIHPKIAPRWRGSLTGAALSAAAAAFVDLILLVFGRVILKKIVSDVGHVTFKIPVSKMTTSVPLPQGGSIQLQLSASANSSLQIFGGDQLLVAVQVTMS